MKLVKKYLDLNLFYYLIEIGIIYSLIDEKELKLFLFPSCIE